MNVKRFEMSVSFQMFVWLESVFGVPPHTAVPVLLPYKPHGSEELFYVPQTEAEVSTTSNSDTTMESSHPGTPDTHTSHASCWLLHFAFQLFNIQRDLQQGKQKKKIRFLDWLNIKAPGALSRGVSAQHQVNKCQNPDNRYARPCSCLK